MICCIEDENILHQGRTEMNIFTLHMDVSLDHSLYICLGRPCLLGSYIALTKHNLVTKVMCVVNNIT